MAGSVAAALAHAGARAADPAPPGPQPFDGATVRRLARERAAADYKPADTTLPDVLAKLDYDAYRAIRFDTAQSLWRGAGLPFEAQFFHRGWLYKERVDLYEVTDGTAHPIVYKPSLFAFGPTPPPTQDDLGFAGFRLHAPINRSDYNDEVCVFLGASYFRAVGRNEGYGLSARGLALRTGDPAGEEFPGFRAFWLERPQKGTGIIVIHALLDGPSCTAAIRFTVRPGDDTTMDMETTLFPRSDLDQLGVGTGTSMFLFDASSRAGIDDYRRAVHDSDGLMMLTGRGEQIWRPLANPRKLQVSSFVDTSPRGFGLVQRKRLLRDYDDLEAHYEKRPSLWVEPIGDWGEGQVRLLEIPTRDETHDNIVAFWRPKTKLPARSEVNYTCRLHWSDLPPVGPSLARFVATRAGAGSAGGSRLFVLDAAGDALKAFPADAPLRLVVSADKGKILNFVAHAAPLIEGASASAPATAAWRVSFELAPGDADAVELRAQLLNGDAPVTETWLYRWTA